MIDRLIVAIVKQIFITAVILYFLQPYLSLPSISIGCGFAKADNRRVTVEPLGGL